MPDEFKKLDPLTELSTEPVEIVRERKSTSDPPVNRQSGSMKKILLIPLILIIILVTIGIIMVLPFRTVYAKAQLVAKSGKEAAAAIKSQNLDLTKTKLAETRQNLTALKEAYNSVQPLGAIPFFGLYVHDGDHGIRAGFAGLDAADKAIEALEPNADLLGLKGKSKFVTGTADERIQTAIKTMNVLIPKINDMATSVDTLRKEIDFINPHRYPVSLGNTKIREPLTNAIDVIDNAANLFINAQPLLTNLPKMLGEPVERRYLVLFQNDKELRPTGGFMTAFAQFRFSHGKAILEKADDIYHLDDAMTKTFPAPREILTFHKGVYQLHLRDSNLSPDFKASMQQFESLYNYVGGREAIDGIVAVDTHVLVEALRILGPLTISGRTFSADIDKRCDCPKAVYELEDYSTRPVNYVRTARKDIIGVLFQTMLQQALGTSPSKYWGQLFQMLFAQISQKHVLTYFHDTAAEKAAESFNMAGRIQTASETATLLKYQEGKGWDYLHVNNSNMAGAKSNMFVSEAMTKDVTVNSDGTITTKLTVDYKNPYPGSDCGLESGGLCLNAPLRNWIRVYVPLGSQLKESKGTVSPQDGKAMPLTAYDSLSKTVFEGFLIVNPLGTAQLTLTYTSPVKPAGGTYRILIQKQPGTDNQQFTVRLNGRDRKKFPLQTDTEIELPL